MIEGLPGPTMRRITALVLLAVTLCACGSRGALYLPPPETDETSVTKPKRR
jgi:predicted small lipoprotein YifL